MRKKKLLFVMPSLAAGGGEKSLVNLLHQIDYDAFEVDLFLFHHEGLFNAYLPKEVRLLPHSQNYRLFTKPFRKSVISLLKSKNWSLAMNRTWYAMTNKRVVNSSLKEQYGWKYLAKSLEKDAVHYDAAIGYLEKSSIYYCVDKVSSQKKIGWIHTDYDQLQVNPSLDSPYFSQLDTIVTVSKQCAHILKQRFPELSHKVTVIHNIVSPEVILQMADEASELTFEKTESNPFYILSVGRLHPQKGFDLAVEACKRLVEEGFHFRWEVIGEGNERKRLEERIHQLSLQEHFVLLGLKANPYPYMKRADLYVQPSRVEGKSIALDEAKIMKKPILVTNYRSAPDQITDQVDGRIVEMNAEAIAEGIKQMIREPQLRDALSEALSKQQLGTEHEIMKLYQLV